jgi:hypothetical protein
VAVDKVVWSIVFPPGDGAALAQLVRSNSPQKLRLHAIRALGIVPREDWRARAPRNGACNRDRRVRDRFSLHHSETPADRPMTRIRGMQDYHLGKGWCDIGYHFLLDPSDPDPTAPVALYEGRQLEGLGLSGGPWTKASAVKTPTVDPRNRASASSASAERA